MTRSDQIAEMLFELLTTCDHKDADALLDLAAEYREHNHHSFRNLTGLGEKLMVAMTEAHDYVRGA